MTALDRLKGFYPDLQHDDDAVWNEKPHFVIWYKEPDMHVHGNFTIEQLEALIAVRKAGS